MLMLGLYTFCHVFIFFNFFYFLLIWLFMISSRFLSRFNCSVAENPQAGFMTGQFFATVNLNYQTCRNTGNTYQI